MNRHNDPDPLDAPKHDEDRESFRRWIQSGGTLDTLLCECEELFRVARTPRSDPAFATLRPRLYQARNTLIGQLQQIDHFLGIKYDR